MSYRTPKLEKFELDGFEFDPNYYLSGDYIDIEESCQQLPPIIEWINEKLQTFTEQKMLTQSLIERAKAEAYFRLKSGELVEKYGTKPTEMALAHALALDSSVQKFEEDYYKLYAWCIRMNNILSSLRDKLNLVRSAESTRRAMIGRDNDLPN